MPAVRRQFKINRKRTNFQRSLRFSCGKILNHKRGGTEGGGGEFRKKGKIRGVRKLIENCRGGGVIRGWSVNTN